MRRFLAFIFMSVTLCLIAAISFKPIYDNTLTGLSLKGGQEVIYRIKERDRFDDGIPSEKMLKDAANKIIERLDIAEVNNPTVAIEGNNHISVLLPNKSTRLLKDIRKVIEASPNFTIRDGQDDELISDSSSLEMFSNLRFYVEEGVSKIEAEIADYDLFKRFAEIREVAEEAYLWLNFDEEKDHLTNLSSSSLTYDVDALKEKFFGSISLDNDPQSADDNAIFTLGQYLDITTFDEAQAKIYNKMMKAGYIADYEIIFIQMQSIEPLFGTNSFFLILIFALIGVAFGFVLLAYRYRIIGIIAINCVAIYSFLSYSFFNFMNSEFGPDILFGLIIGAAIVILLVLNLGERLKNEIYKGRALNKAYLEASKKSFSTIIGSLIALIITSLILYLVSIRIVRNFATITLVSTIIVLVIIQPLMRFLLHFACNSNYFAQRLGVMFNIKEKFIPDVSKDEVQTYFGEYSKYNLLKNAKQYMVGFLSLIVVGVLGFVMFSLVIGKGINIGTPYSVGTRILMTSQTSQFQEAEKIANQLVDVLDIEIYEEHVTVTTTTDYSLQDFYHISVRVDEKISEQQIEDLNQFIVDFNDQQVRDLLELNYVAEINQTMAISIYLYALLAALIAIASLFIYYSLFFKLTYGVAGAVGALIDMLIPFSLVTLLQLQVGYEILTVTLGIMLLSLYVKAVLFDLIKEQADNYKKADTLTLETRQNIINTALQQMFGRLSMTLLFAGLVVLAIMLNTNSHGFALFFTVLVGIVSIMVTTLMISPQILLMIEKNFAISKEKAAAKRKIKKSKPKKHNEPEEFTFIGIND